MSEAKPKPTPPTPRLPKPPRYFPGKVASFIIVACLLTILLTRVFQEVIARRAPMFDDAFLNLSTLILGFIASMTFFLWFLIRSSYPGLVRLLTFLAVTGSVFLFFFFFRLSQFSGNMVPQFTPRFSRPPDAVLGKVSIEKKNAPINLTKSSDADFPQFLGPSRDNYLPGPPLADWSAAPPKELWRRKIGAGWSSFSAVNGYAVTMEQRGNEEWVTCYEARTGSPVWGHSVITRHEIIPGGIGPRSTPTIHQGKVYALGATGILRCLDGATGKLLWQDDLLVRYGFAVLVPDALDLKSAKKDLSPGVRKLMQTEAEQIVMWGRSNSPLVVNNMLVLPAGGVLGASKSLVAYDIDTGEVVWEGGERQVSYSSPSLFTLSGVRQIVIVNEDTVTGNDIKTGKELWSHPWPGKSNGPASSSQTHVVGQDRLLLSKGYGIGAELIEVKLADGKWQIESIEKNPRVLKTKHTNVTIIGEHAYGLSDGVLECVELATLEAKWKKGRYGHGQVLGVGDKILVLGERGELALVAADPEEFRELGKIQALQGQTWNNLCLTGKLLLIRNAEEAACYELP